MLDTKGLFPSKRMSKTSNQASAALGKGTFTTRRLNKCVEVQVNSSFYSEADMITELLNNTLKDQLNTQPVKHIDPSEMKSIELMGIEQKRFRAALYLRNYHGRNGFLNSIRHASKRHRLSEKQCDAVIKMCRELK